MPKKLLLILVPFIFFSTIVTKANATGNVLINEFYAMGDSSSNPDWIELYNISDEKISIEGWIIRDSTDSNKIGLNGYICPKSFRKFDFSNKLNKDGDKIRLLDSTSATDPSNEVEYFSDQIPKHAEAQSTSRQPNGSDVWSILTDPTPTNDESCAATPTPTPSPTPTNSPSTASTPTPTPKVTTATSTKKSSTPSPTNSPTPSPQTPKDQNVLGQKDFAQTLADAKNDFSNPSPTTTTSDSPQIGKYAPYLFAVGAIFIGLSLVFYLWYTKNSQTPQINKERDRFEQNQKEE